MAIARRDLDILERVFDHRSAGRRGGEFGVTVGCVAVVVLAALSAATVVYRHVFNDSPANSTTYANQIFAAGSYVEIRTDHDEGSCRRFQRWYIGPASEGPTVAISGPDLSWTNVVEKPGVADIAKPAGWYRWAARSLQVIEVDVHCDRDIGRT
jgi:hypothetical protein